MENNNDFRIFLTTKLVILITLLKYSVKNDYKLERYYNWSKRSNTK